jgi:hypothetical protein
MALYSSVVILMGVFLGEDEGFHRHLALLDPAQSGKDSYLSTLRERGKKGFWVGL